MSNVIPMNSDGSDSKHSTHNNLNWVNNVWPHLEAYVENKKSLIDVGCGNGRRSSFFANHVTTVVGIDVAKEAYDNIATENIKNVQYIHGDIMTEKFEDEKFDVVYCEGTFYFLVMTYGFDHAFKKMTSILNNNGTLIILEGDWRVCHKSGVAGRYKFPRTHNLEELTNTYDYYIHREEKPIWGGAPSNNLLSFIRKNSNA